MCTVHSISSYRLHIFANTKRHKFGAEKKIKFEFNKGYEMNLSFLMLTFFLSFVIVVGLNAERLHSMLVFLLMFLTGSLIDNFFFLSTLGLVILAKCSRPFL